MPVVRSEAERGVSATCSQLNQCLCVSGKNSSPYASVPQAKLQITMSCIFLEPESHSYYTNMASEEQQGHKH